MQPSDFTGDKRIVALYIVDNYGDFDFDKWEMEREETIKDRSEQQSLDEQFDKRAIEELEEDEIPY